MPNHLRKRHHRDPAQLAKHTGREDIGSHTVCAVMTAAFLEFSKSRGNDLSTPMPEFGFRGLKPGEARQDQFRNGRVLPGT